MMPTGRDKPDMHANAPGQPLPPACWTVTAAVARRHCSSETAPSTAAYVTAPCRALAVASTPAPPNTTTPWRRAESPQGASGHCCAGALEGPHEERREDIP